MGSGGRTGWAAWGGEWWVEERQQEGDADGVWLNGSGHARG